MGLLYDLSNKYKTLSIVGMAKNAGKTTALNFLIEEAMDEGIVLGITSTGRDGETQDLVTGTEKPRVYLDQGTLVSVPSQLFGLADAGLEILRRTKYSTAIGELLICLTNFHDVGEIQAALYAVGHHVHGKSHHVHVTRALAVAKQGSLDSVRAGKNAKFRIGNARAAVVMRMHGKNDAVPVL